MPEEVEAFAGGLAHRPFPPLAADEEADDDHRQRAGGVEAIGQRIAADDRGQRDQHLDPVIVDRCQDPVHEPANAQAQHDPTDSLVDEEVHRFTGRG